MVLFGAEKRFLDWVGQPSRAPVCRLSATNRHCWRSSEPVLMQHRSHATRTCRKDILKLMADHWKTPSDSDKAKYVQQSDQDKCSSVYAFSRTLSEGLGLGPVPLMRSLAKHARRHGRRAIEIVREPGGNRMPHRHPAYLVHRFTTKTTDSRERRALMRSNSTAYLIQPRFPDRAASRKPIEARQGHRHRHRQTHQF